MKMKNLTFLDRHLHHVVLAVALLFLAIVVFFYVTGEPYSVDVGRGEMLSPREVEPKIATAAKRLRDAVTSTDLPKDFPALTVPKYSEGFERRHQRSLSGPGITRLQAPFNHPGLDIDSGDKVIEGPQLVMPPTPTGVHASVSFGVLDPGQNLQEWKEATPIGDQEPLDFLYTTVRAVFDMGLYRQRWAELPVEKRPLEDDIRKSLAVVDVILWRQMMDPITGEWGEPTIVRPMPGRTSHRGVSRDFQGENPQELVTRICVTSS
jgi:hypothetical protein